MEGGQLEFFITYQDYQALITLSEYDTVEQLKIEIDNNFSIPYIDQVISGWQSIPESDDIILKNCVKTNELNCLIVSNSKYENTGDVSELTFRSDLTQMEVDSQGSNMGMEIEVSRRLQESLGNTPLKLCNMSLKDVVSNFASNFEGKGLILYLHNSHDAFTQNFLLYIHDGVIADILESSFVVVGWNIEDESYHNPLLDVLQSFPSLAIISHLITEKKSAAVCIRVDENKPAIFSCLRGDLSYQEISNRLTNLKTELNCGGRPEQSSSQSSSQSSEQDNLSNTLQLEAIKSLRRKVPPNISTIFRHCTLDDAINFVCTAPFDERRALLLYLHNSEHPFSKMFLNNLAGGEMVQILNRSFFILGWDIEQPKYHSALTHALNEHVNLSVVSDLVTSKVAVGLCIIPVNGTISVFLCLRGKITLSETIKNLKQVEKVFTDEISQEKELKKLANEKCNENDLGSEELHGIWADMLGDRDYDSFEYDQHELLKDKIGFALKGPPQKETGYDSKAIKHIDMLYGVIKIESNEIAEYKDKVEISFIYNCLEPLPEEKIKRANKFTDYNPKTDVNPVPVFVLRRCRGSDNPCRIFIDDTGRVYRTWTGYLTKNKFPECQMVVPLNGRYQVYDDDKVSLERHLSPACHLDTKLLQVGDIVSTAAGLASGAVFMAAAIPAIPVAVPLLVTAGVVGATAGVWAIGRSAYTLFDRNFHKETMSFLNSEARGAYLNIVAGSLGFMGAGANLALAQLARSGVNIGQGATTLVNTVGILNLGAGGASLANSGYEVFDQWYNENQTPSALTILQLSTSVLFFGHAVYNFRGAQTIIDETQARVLQDYQDSLRSNRHRKTFNKLMKETFRNHGDGARGRAEVISAIRNIQNRDEVFAALTRNNRAMNRADVRFSAEAGEIRLNGVSVDMNELVGLNKKQSETFLSNIPKRQTAQIPSVSNINNNTSLNSAVNNVLADIHVDESRVNITQLVQLTSELLMFCNSDTKTKVVDAVHQVVRYVINQFSIPFVEEIDKIIPKNSQYFEFLRVGISFFSKLVDDWEHQYQEFQRTKDEKYYDPLFTHINPLYAKRTVELFEFVVNNSYSGATLTIAVIEKFSKYITAWITRVIFEDAEKKEYEKRRVIHSAGFRVKRINCSDCGGYYFTH